MWSSKFPNVTVTERLTTPQIVTNFMVTTVGYPKRNMIGFWNVRAFLGNDMLYILGLEGWWDGKMVGFWIVLLPLLPH